VVIGGSLLLNRSTDGQSSHYVIEMPAAHGIKAELVRPFLRNDLAGGFLLALATL